MVGSWWRADTDLAELQPLGRHPKRSVLIFRRPPRFALASNGRPCGWRAVRGSRPTGRRQWPAPAVCPIRRLRVVARESRGHRRTWESEVKALGIVAPDHHELLELLGGLDAFGDDCHAEQVGKFDDLQNDGVTDPIVIQVANELLVDLDGVRGNRIKWLSDQ